MCGRRKLEREGKLNPETLGHMELELVHAIATQIPPRVTACLHWNGESLCHPQVGMALSYFKHTFTTLNTNGILLVQKANEIIGNLDNLTLSVVQDDPEASEQWETLQEFLALKGDLRPKMVYRLLGDVDPEPWKTLPGLVATRILHAPEMSRNYERPVTVPEDGVCRDMMSTVAIDFQGNVNHCVRFDPEGLGRIGELTGPRKASLEEIVESIQHWQWHDHPRQGYIDRHISGQRDMVPLCKGCDFWGVPVGRFEPYGSEKKFVETRGDFHPGRKEVSWLIPEVKTDPETEETSDIPPPEGEENEQATGFGRVEHQCDLCLAEGKVFIAKTGGGLASHKRLGHERRFKGERKV